MPEWTNGWTFTDDAIGHIPKRDFRCKTRVLNDKTGKSEFCDTPMFIRHSTVGTKKGWKMGVNIVTYKCPACDWFTTFEVRRPREEIEKILEHREGKSMLIPQDMWLTHTEAKLIKRKLKDLGYV